MQQPMLNPEDILDPTTVLDMALKLMSKAFQLNNIIPTNNNQRSSSNPCSSQIAQSLQNVGHLVGQNAVQNQAARAEAKETGCGLSSEIAQKEEARIQLTFEEFDFMAAASACEETEKVTTNCNLQDNLQQASTSGTQSDKAPVYDLDGSAEGHHSNFFYDDDIFNMFTQEEHMEQGGGTVEQHPVNVEETRVLYDSLYNNLAIEVEKVNSVNRKLRETNVDLTTELARYKNQEKCFKISQEKYDKLERCYQNFQKKKSTVSSLLEEKKKLKSDFKIREDKLLDKQIQLENKIKELDNILVKTGQSIQTMHMLSPKPDLFYHTEQKMALGYQNPFYLKQAQRKQQSLYNGKVLFEKHDSPVVHDSEETLQLAQESRLKMKQLNKEIKPANYTKINHLSGVFVSQTAKSQEEVYFLNTSKTATVSKSIL
ncbi:hypothetical protein Tco_1107619 [Tanacetum coccineum]